MKPIVAIGFLGSTLDAGKFDASRWNKWRPSVGLCMHEDLRIDRFVLLHGTPHGRLAESVAKDIASVSPETQVDRHLIDFTNAWDFEEVYGKLLDFARAYPFDPDAEDYLVHITTGTHVAQICLFLLTEAHYLPGRLIQTQPQRGSPSNAPGSWDIIDLDLSRYDSIATRFAAVAAESTSFLKSGIDTRNVAFNRMIDDIEQVAVRSKAPVLLMGPTGAGKSQLARRIYELKRLKHQVRGPFVEVNCATLKGDGAMSALFGHKKGAFTGAAADRPGLLRTADTGTLFLDEIGELGIDEQAMILRAIEDKRFLPVGADKERQPPALGRDAVRRPRLCPARRTAAARRDSPRVRRCVCEPRTRLRLVGPGAQRALPGVPRPCPRASTACAAAREATPGALQHLGGGLFRP
ncbi:sigma54-dependent transcription regulator [Sphingomonas sp. UYEF23]